MSRNRNSATCHTTSGVFGGSQRRRLAGGAVERAALRTRYGVSGQTVQHAMNEQPAQRRARRDQGWPGAGLGWFVRKLPDVVRLPRRSEPGRGRAQSTWSDCGVEEDGWLRDVVTVLRFDVASTRIAAELRIEPGAEIVARERTM